MINFFSKELLNSESIKPGDPIDPIVYPTKKQNSFLNSIDDFGTLKKGVVLDNQTYKYEVNENDNSFFTIIELGDESKEMNE